MAAAPTSQTSIPQHHRYQMHGQRDAGMSSPAMAVPLFAPDSNHVHYESPLKKSVSRSGLESYEKVADAMPSVENTFARDSEPPSSPGAVSTSSVSSLRSEMKTPTSAADESVGRQGSSPTTPSFNATMDALSIGSFASTTDDETRSSNESVVLSTQGGAATGDTAADLTPKFKKKKKKKKLLKPLEFKDKFEMTGTRLGEGAYSVVEECQDKATDEILAVKIITKDVPETIAVHVRMQVLQEVDLLMECSGHENILTLVSFFETVDKYMMVFEKLDGGELLQHIQERKTFTEREASLVTRDMASALSFIHAKGIAHRDLKPQNVLCKRNDCASPAKLCDFNLGIGTNDGSITPPISTPVGTPEYMSPEVVRLTRGEDAYYDKRCDIWSLGVILYIMLSGKAPFSPGDCGISDCKWQDGGHCETCLEILQDEIQYGRVDFEGMEWQRVSGAAKDLIARMLVPEGIRLSADQMLDHPWLKHQAPTTPLDTPLSLRRESAVEFFETFAIDANQTNRFFEDAEMNPSASHHVFTQKSRSRDNSLNPPVDLTTVPIQRSRSREGKGTTSFLGRFSQSDFMKRRQVRRKSALVEPSFSLVKELSLENVRTPRIEYGES